MNARFFYARHMDHQNNTQTWAKLYVLTQDGTLYCDYLEWMASAKIIKTVDYLTFKPGDFSYKGYQHLEEISYEKAIATNLTRQPNWIDNYLRSKGLL